MGQFRNDSGGESERRERSEAALRTLRTPCPALPLEPKTSDSPRNSSYQWQEAIYGFKEASLKLESEELRKRERGNEAPINDGDDASSVN